MEIPVEEEDDEVLSLDQAIHQAIGKCGMVRVRSSDETACSRVATMARRKRRCPQALVQYNPAYRGRPALPRLCPIPGAQVRDWLGGWTGFANQ